MILGILYRNYKSFKNITYIPISNGDKFCSLIGRNGVGKSSVLESLDVFFNKRSFNRNINNNRDEAYITPIFCIKKESIEFSEDEKSLVEKYSSVVWDIISKEPTTPTINYNYIELFKALNKHFVSIADNNITEESHYIIPIGLNPDRVINLGIFRDLVFLEALTPDTEASTTDARVAEACDKLAPILTKIESYYQYVYIPKDVEPEKIVQFETKEIQTLLGKNLEKIVSDLLSKDTIQEISTGLKAFIENLSRTITGYKFKHPSSYQPNLKPDKIYSLIIDDFFSTRELHKESKDGKELSLKQLSSGEKQQAILNLVYSIIKNYRKNNNLIIAVDEPESSLHISACYNQFERLNELSLYCPQILVTSHWYGFIPAMLNGTITNICFDNHNHTAYIFNIRKYREEIKLENKEYRQKLHTELPIDVMLKGSNDFIQSVLMSVINKDEGEAYNWLICEGSSDKIYLDAYLSDLVQNKKLRVIPVCSASEVKNTYNRLKVLFEEVKNILHGRVFLLIDTDAQSFAFETDPSLEQYLRARRIVNCEDIRHAKLVKTDLATNPKAPNTDIEDALNGKTTVRALSYFKEEYDLTFVDEECDDESSSYYALDLRHSDKTKLDNFFNANHGDNKVMFANKYIEHIHEETQTPPWIDEIKTFFYID